MIRSKDLTQGSILEVTSTNDMMFFGSPLNLRTTKLLVGEQYEVLKVSKSPIGVSLQQMNGDKKGDIFLIFISGSMKIISQPQVKEVIKKYNNQDFQLNPDEEFLLTSKTHPNRVFKDYQPANQPLEKDDILLGNLVLSKKSGQRKRFKNKLALLGYLNNLTGLFSDNMWYDFFKNDEFYKENKEIAKEQKYHLHAVLSNLPNWLGGNGLSTLEDLRDLEIKKYDTQTRKILPEVIDFDVYEHVQKFSHSFQITRLYGEAVSKVVTELMKNNQLDQTPYLFATQFDFKKFQYEYQIPTEKDIYLDVALKKMGLKKKDVIQHNDKGFMCIAFASEDERQQFAKEYQNKEKLVKFLSVYEVLAHPELNPVKNIKKLVL